MSTLQKYSFVFACFLCNTLSAPLPAKITGSDNDIIEAQGAGFVVEDKRAQTVKAQGKGKLRTVQIGEVNSIGKLEVEQSEFKTINANGKLTCRESTGDNIHAVGEVILKKSTIRNFISVCGILKAEESTLPFIQLAAQKAWLHDSTVEKLIMKKTDRQERTWLEWFFGLNAKDLPTVNIKNSIVKELIFENDDGIVELLGPQAQVLNLKGGQIKREN